MSNAILVSDFAQRFGGKKTLTADGVVKEASVRVRSVVMTASVVFFALLPLALGRERDSEGNTPLGRAFSGDAGIPCLFALAVVAPKNAKPA